MADEYIATDDYSSISCPSLRPDKTEKRNQTLGMNRCPHQMQFSNNPANVTVPDFAKRVWHPEEQDPSGTVKGLYFYQIYDPPLLSDTYKAEYRGTDNGTPVLLMDTMNTTDTHGPIQKSTFEVKADQPLHSSGGVPHLRHFNSANVMRFEGNVEQVNHVKARELGISVFYIGKTMELVE